jgi:hypothetical protein
VLANLHLPFLRKETEDIQTEDRRQKTEDRRGCSGRATRPRGADSFRKDDETANEHESTRMEKIVEGTKAGTFVPKVRAYALQMNSLFLV